jgi:hypothetical protein
VVIVSDVRGYSDECSCNDDPRNGFEYGVLRRCSDRRLDTMSNCGFDDSLDLLHCDPCDRPSRVLAAAQQGRADIEPVPNAIVGREAGAHPVAAASRRKGKWTGGTAIVGGGMPAMK